ncbi:uncharacterized protein CTHT_0062730 [Thermochaetoides thermophila DSM 1495]|uniref:Interferon-related developmental regulator N-terminal domain-containing protein n=1 Tax=Chaetomium thermophilum (strain DSM 1495 / CBS 144.50 / IMI 039719) TaxID=759272 RepID=G0SE74_CHATD|nr:hypothetical protein CTHT_0062730 [Thermochaetoides thermophila DSM 1495]EGS18251.1 hypothetical protein CTHT_0062730 [Thermochaetoides thermophila DSM 1495]
MSQLQRRALKGEKTMSKKARAKREAGLSPFQSPSASGAPSPAVSQPSSRPGSRPGSRLSSRPASHYGSDDEFEGDDYLGFEDSASASSGEEGLTWADRLLDLIRELQGHKDQKRTSVQDRELALAGYSHILRHHYAEEHLSSVLDDILPTFLKQIRAGRSNKERARALQAFTLTLLTCPSDKDYEQAISALKTVCEDVEDNNVKIDAIHALCVAVIYGGGNNAATEELLDFFLEIVSTDGDSVRAPDDGSVVTAALQAWAFLATHVDDLTVKGEEAVESFLDQLDSADSDVKVNAGANLALLFEAAREQEEETGQSFITAYNQHRIMTQMAKIMRDSSKTISKKGRRHVRTNFSSIVTSVERGKGPGYSTAGRWGNPHTGGTAEEEIDGGFAEFGYREKIRLPNRWIVINTWFLRARAELLKTLLGGGLLVHYEENPTVRELFRGADVEFTPAKKFRK